MFHDFWFFLGAVWGHATTLAAGCIVTVMLGIIEKHVLKRPISLKVEIGVLLGFVFFACFQAWEDEYKLLSAKPANTPNIQVNVPAVSIPPPQVVIPQSEAQMIFEGPVISKGDPSNPVPYLTAGAQSSYNLPCDNAGRSTARTFKAAARLEIMDTPSPIKDDPNELEKMTKRKLESFLKEVKRDIRKRSNGTNVPAGRAVYITVVTPVLSADDVDAIFHGDKTILIMQYGEWIDNAGKQTTNYCGWLQPPPRRQPDVVVWHVCG